MDSQLFLIESVDAMWSMVLERRDSHRPFARALRAFVAVTFHPVLLLLSATELPVWDMQQKVIWGVFYDLFSAQMATSSYLPAVILVDISA